jgi:hypothetical protein
MLLFKVVAILLITTLSVAVPDPKAALKAAKAAVANIIKPLPEPPKTMATLAADTFFLALWKVLQAVSHQLEPPNRNHSEHDKLIYLFDVC